MPEVKPLVGGSVKVKIKVGLQFISHGSGTSAVLDSTGTELDPYTSHAYGYTNATGQTYFLDVDSSNNIVFSTSSTPPGWTQAGSGTTARVQTTVGTATMEIDVNPTGAPIVDSSGTEASIVEVRPPE